LNWLKQFGFGEVTTIDLPGEASGFLPTPSWYTHTLHTTWTPIDTLLVASGAGPDAITPIQLAVATASLANGGKVWQPQILQRLIAPSGRVLTQLQTHLLRSIPISLETRALITQALEAHEKTFDQALALPPVAGISAIATSPDTEGTIPVVDSWWTGFASSQDPQIALSVIVVDDPIGTEASQVARTVLQAYFHPSHTGDS
jgi:penicillin-binding protein 2